MRDLLTVAQAAEMLGISPGAVRCAIYEKRLPFVDVYGRRMLRPSIVEAYRARTQPTGEKARGRPRKTPVDAT